MDVREKLVELLQHDDCPLFMVFGDKVDVLADYLIAHGVTILDCKRDCANCWKTKLVTPMWISVKDGLPEIGREVLFVRENGNYGVGAYSDTYRDFFSGRFPVKSVSHWMPMPQPPKGELG